MLEEAMKANEKTAADERELRWRAIRELYPYLDVCAVEHAIALDETGKREEALEVIYEAILLKPVEWMRWQSFGVILERLGHSQAALVAKVVSRQIQDRANDSETAEPA